jgi:hypothetical protein
MPETADVHGRTSAAGGRMPETARSDEAILKSLIPNHEIAEPRSQ